MIDRGKQFCQVSFFVTAIISMNRSKKVFQQPVSLKKMNEFDRYQAEDSTRRAFHNSSIVYPGDSHLLPVEPHETLRHRTCILFPEFAFLR
jgi:hypothetical protein